MVDPPDLAAAFPGASVTVVRVDEPQAVPVLAAAGPFDAVIDLGPPESLIKRFTAGFLYARRGGVYAVVHPPVDGHAFLEHLNSQGIDVQAAGLPSAQPPEPALLHGRARLSSGLLLVTNRTARAQRKLNEVQTDAYLAAHPETGRVLEAYEAESVSAPIYREGPMARKAPTNRPIGTSRITLREYYDVMVTARQVVGTEWVLFADTFRHGVNRRHRQLKQLTPGFARVKPPWPETAQHLSGTYLHLDDEFRGHFGHVLTETAGRIWTWQRALEIDPDVKVLVGGYSLRPEISEWEYEIYQAWGIPRDRFVTISEPVRVERLISGTSHFSNPDYVHPAVARAWDELGDRLASHAELREQHRRIFVSRKIAKRSCTNSPEVEAFFAAHGFTVVYPEEFSLADQVALFRAAEVIAGFGGSGLFQAALVKEPKRLITIAHSEYVARNEYFIAAVRGHEMAAVICPPDEPGLFQSTFKVDFEREGPLLREILEALPASTA